jgi:hypothetical protein
MIAAVELPPAEATSVSRERSHVYATTFWEDIGEPSAIGVSDLAFADFNADRTADVFATWSGKWHVRYGGIGAWQDFGDPSALGVANLAFADFNADQKADVFATWSGRWHVRYGGIGPWQDFGDPSALGVANLRFADFDGDHKADVFATWSGRWHVRYGGIGAWQDFADPSNLGVQRLAFADFDGDGMTDVFGTWGSQWHIRYAGGGPAIQADLIHPDADRRIKFTASRGSLVGPVSQMQIEVRGGIVTSAPTETATFTGGPYSPVSNSSLPFCAIATMPANSRRRCDWVYIANPKGVYTSPAPNGSNDGYPDATSEQTGPNLYRLDKPVVGNRALDAVVEYVDWFNAQTPSTADDISAVVVENTADLLVAAIAWYVDAHMTWRDDGANQTVFANNGYGNYNPGWDFPQPADLTLTISGNLTNADPTDDYEGDCEDHAILRAALLRALGFAPWAIWDAINNPVSHEYNIVLYEGAYRIMDYGTIDRYLTVFTEPHRTYYGWNESNGPRGTNTANHDFLVTQVDNYPGGKTDGQPWGYKVYFKATSP